MPEAPATEQANEYDEPEVDRIVLAFDRALATLRQVRAELYALRRMHHAQHACPETDPAPDRPPDGNVR